jgi:manganese/zinc/iron transport system substrate-binding protein
MPNFVAARRPLAGRPRGRFVSVVVATITALAMAGPPSLAAAGVGALPRVVVTTGPLGDVAAEVAGPCLEVTTLMGPGVDPHLYRASARDVQSLQRADLVLFHGLGLEGQLGQVLGRLGSRVASLAVAEAAIPAEALLFEGDGLVDPHVWMDPTLWALVPPLLAERFAELAPECRDDLAARATALVAVLHALDTWAAEAIATVPPAVRVLVSAHDAFGYLARRYGLEVVAIQGISTEAEPSVRDVRETAELVASRGVPAVFFETSISPRTVEAVIAAARDRGADVRVGGELYGDALGARGTAAGTYPGMIVHTVATVALGLGGEVPAPQGALAAWAAGWPDLPTPAAVRP